MPPPTTATSKPAPAAGDPKHRGANRSTKVAGKLKVLPEQTEPDLVPSPRHPAPKSARISDPDQPTIIREDESESTADSDEDVDDDSEGVKVYNEIARIPEGTAKRDALRLTKKKAKSLPRVTAFATASTYKTADLIKFFKARRTSYHTDPRIIDGTVYTPYSYDPPHPADASSAQQESHDLLGIPELNSDSRDEREQHRRRSKFDTTAPVAEIFIFEYGTVVIWGMTEAQEKRFLSSIKRFEIDRLSSEDVEMEDLNFYYANYSRIYNDVITLRKGSSYMTKLSISHALSQSVKISLFEETIATKIDETKDIPDEIAETGRVGLPQKEIMRRVGELFLLRTNINSVGSVLDSPEVFWSFPDLQPLYDAARSYLEIPQRIKLLNTRVEVLQDMLQLLKDTVSSRHSERLETIVIILIGVEILLGIITILVDLLA